jgi:hypothetical protein
MGTSTLRMGQIAIATITRYVTRDRSLLQDTRCLEGLTNSFLSQCFLRGFPHLCKYMPTPYAARRLMADPQNEPDFYKITKLYPIPDGEVHKEVDVSETKQVSLVSSLASVPLAFTSEGKPAPAHVSDWRLDQAPPCKIPRLSIEASGMTPCLPHGWPQLAMDATQVRAALQMEKATKRQTVLINLKFKLQAEMELLAEQRRRAEHLQWVAAATSHAAAVTAALLNNRNGIHDPRLGRFL